MQLFDTHTHLVDPSFAPDLEVVLERARAAGVSGIVVVSETLDEAHAVVALCRQHAPLLRPAAGLFPTHLDLEQADAVAAFVRAHASELVAIGEVGLDYRVVEDEAGREVQREILRRFVALSRETGLPLNVHSRSAGHHTIAWLLEHGATRVQLHAYDGKASSALPAVEAGYFFSVPPSIVRSPQKQKLVAQVPLEHLLLETDSPVLGAQPGERNEPANVHASLRAIAEIKKLPEARVAEVLLDNTRRLYPTLACELARAPCTESS